MCKFLQPYQKRMNNFVLFFHGGYYYYYFWKGPVCIRLECCCDCCFSIRLIFLSTIRKTGNKTNRGKREKLLKHSGSCRHDKTPAALVVPYQPPCSYTKNKMWRKTKKKQKKKREKDRDGTQQRVTSSYWARPLQVFDEARDLNTLHARLCTTGTQLSVWLRVSAIFC